VHDKKMEGLMGTCLHKAGVALLLSAALLAGASGPAIAQTQAEIDGLARDVGGVEAVRAVKNLQRHYAQYVQLGLWQEAADLFSRNGQLIWGDKQARGVDAVAAWLRERGGGDGLKSGVLHTEFIDEPLLSLSDDRQSAQSRWMSLTFAGDGNGKTRIESGVYENDYVLEDGVWKIALAHYHPQFEGDYANGWTNIGGEDLPIVPYHITPDQTGRPIPPSVGSAPGSGATLPELESRIAALNDEDGVRNVQNSYGYYVDRKMWDDVVDLFANDARVEIAGVGTFAGKAAVRKALEQRMGAAGLQQGQLNDHPLFATLVKVMHGGAEAYTRGIELGMLGDQSANTAGWAINIFRNRFVKEDGLWKLRELRIFPLMLADYDKGWGDGGKAKPASVPAFLGAHPVTGKPVALKAAAATKPLTGIVRPKSAAAQLSGEQRYAEAKRRLARSLAFDASENVSSAYGFYIDDFMWDEMGAIFAEKGNKQSPFTGYYLGRDRIMGAVNATWGPVAPTRPGISYHWRTQPVILVSHDGRSANLRTRLFQPRTGKEVEGAFYGANFSSGMYPNDQLILEGDIWRLWSLTIDEHYFSMSSWKSGWNGVKPKPPRPAQPTELSKKYPPDITLPELGRREEGFRGGTGTAIDWPGILPMWFNYRNLVSGREPKNYWPDCVPCEILPSARLTSFGYQMPPTGPNVDGVVVK
jgi:hypothetical protein